MVSIILWNCLGRRAAGYGKPPHTPGSGVCTHVSEIQLHISLGHARTPGVPERSFGLAQKIATSIPGPRPVPVPKRLSQLFTHRDVRTRCRRLDRGW